MSIVFRCPDCDHKLRASASAAGRQSKCKCGSVVTIPAAAGFARGSPRSRPTDDSHDETASAWQLEPSVGAVGDLCEAITAWSPLCAQGAMEPDRYTRPPVRYWLGVLVGASAMLAVVGVVCLIVALRSRPEKEEPVAQNPADKVVPQQPPPGKPPEKPKLVEKPKPVEKPKAVEKTEIIEWYTVSRMTVIDESGKDDVFELNDDVKNQLTLVIVNARVPASWLAGRVFDVLDSDATLTAPSAADPFRAIGCGVGKQWFAPPKGRHVYQVPKTGFVIQSWLMIAPVKDLESGRTTFQYRDEPAMTLTRAAKKPFANGP